MFYITKEQQFLYFKNYFNIQLIWKMKIINNCTLEYYQNDKFYTLLLKLLY